MKNESLRDELKKIRNLIIDAIYFMDEKGRALDQNNHVLWNEYWDELRTNLVESINIIDENINRED